MDAKKPDGNFWEEVTQEVRGTVEVSLIAVKQGHLEQTSALMENDVSQWWTVFHKIKGPSPRFYEIMMLSNFHSSQHMVLLPSGNGIIPSLRTMMPSEVSFRSCDAVLARILLPVYFANDRIWPLLENVLVESCYRDMLWYYGSEFGSLYLDFIEAITIAEGQEYSQRIKDTIERLELFSPQVANIALMANVFFEIVPCKFSPEEKERE